MRFAAKLMMAVALTAGAAATADAQGQRQRGTQPPGGGMMRFGGGGMNAFGLVATSKPLQEELKLSEETVAKVKEALKPIDEKRREGGRFDFQNATAEERKEWAEKQAKFADDTKKAITAALDEKQNKRLGQINYQMMGVRLFADKDAQAALKVTDEQKEKVKVVVDDFTKDATELQRAAFQGFQPGGDREEMQKKMAEMQKKVAGLTKEAEEKVMALMTDDQKKMHKDMLGEKFDTSKLVPGGRPMRKDD